MTSDETICATACDWPPFSYALGPFQELVETHGDLVRISWQSASVHWVQSLASQGGTFAAVEVSAASVAMMKIASGVKIILRRGMGCNSFNDDPRIRGLIFLLGPHLQARPRLQRRVRFRRRA